MQSNLLLLQAAVLLLLLPVHAFRLHFQHHHKKLRCSDGRGTLWAVTDSSLNAKKKPRGLRARLIRHVQQKETKDLPVTSTAVADGPDTPRNDRVTAAAIVDTQPFPISPEAATDSEAAAVERALQDLFMRQIGLKEEDTASAIDPPSSNTDEISSLESSEISFVPPRVKVENPTELVPGSVVELLYQKRPAFGNIVSRTLNDLGKGNSVVVRLSSGVEITVDVAQIISIWDVLADEQPPSGQAGWAHVATEALAELQRMSPRKSDLSEFWRIVSKQRSKSLAVDSLDVGVYIFQESKFKNWVDQFDDGSQSRVHALTAAQRYAAALILHSDYFHFKRQSSRFITSDELPDDDFSRKPDNIDSIDGDVDLIIEGGYKVLDAGLVSFKECETFESYYRERKGDGEGVDEGKASAFRTSCITRQLRMLELYALSQKSRSSGATPKAVKMLLKRLGLPVNPLGARQALLDMGYNSNLNQEKRFQPRFRSSDLDVDNSVFRGDPNSPHAVAAAVQARIVEAQSTRDLSALDGYALNITPWPEEVLDAAQKLKNDCESFRQQLQQSVLSIPTVGKTGPTGRLDFRAASDTNPVICIDQRKAEFFDDAFSLSPRTGELLIHVIDVANFLRKYKALENIAKERIMSTFLPSGPLHMLPPQALDALKLSTDGPNEVLTVALQIDFETGSIIRTRIFPATIGPVFPVDIDTANEFISGIGVSEVTRSGRKTIVSQRAGYPDAVVTDLLRANHLLNKVLETQEWIAAGHRNRQPSSYRVDKRTGTVQSSASTGSSNADSYQMLNIMLTLYSNATYNYCMQGGLSVPIVWDNRDRIHSDRIRRFGTQPLRNWIAQLQQRQLRAAFKMELPLSRKDCAMAVAHHNAKRKQHAGIISSTSSHKQKKQISFEAFENHCAMLQQQSRVGDGFTPVMLSGRATGNGGSVFFESFGVHGVVQDATLKKGEEVQVEVLEIKHDSRSIKLKLVA